MDFEQAVEFLILPESNRVEAMLDNPEKYAEEMQGWVRHHQEYRDGHDDGGNPSEDNVIHTLKWPLPK
jgi:hypothetical protein